MPDTTLTMKLHLYPDSDTVIAFQQMTKAYTDACNCVSQYIFDHDFVLNSNAVQKEMYASIRAQFHLKAQMAVSVFKTVTARYKTVREQMLQNPYKYKNEESKWEYIPRTLEWLRNPICFHRPQADLVRGRDYSFVEQGTKISVNTLGQRAVMRFDKPDYYAKYFDGTWSFGTGKIVYLQGEWYLHIPVTKSLEQKFKGEQPAHVVGLDRGLRFLVTSYDEKGKTIFVSGKEIAAKRRAFAAVRAELQTKGTKSAKRALKRISGRENRWMSDVNHRITKTLVDKYGENTLFVMEDLTGVSFAETNQKGKDANRELHSWAFYQFEQFLDYKAKAMGSEMLRVSPKYTSQRCPKCGRIYKENRHHDTHEYICDACGYRSNDDRIGAMNLQFLGTLYISGDSNPRFGIRKES